MYGEKRERERDRTCSSNRREQLQVKRSEERRKTSYSVSRTLHSTLKSEIGHREEQREDKREDMKRERDDNKQLEFQQTLGSAEDSDEGQKQGNA